MPNPAENEQCFINQDGTKLQASRPVPVSHSTIAPQVQRRIVQGAAVAPWEQSNNSYHDAGQISKDSTSTINSSGLEIRDMRQQTGAVRLGSSAASSNSKTTTQVVEVVREGESDDEIEYEAPRLLVHERVAHAGNDDVEESFSDQESDNYETAVDIVKAVREGESDDEIEYEVPRLLVHERVAHTGSDDIEESSSDQESNNYETAVEIVEAVREGESDGEIEYEVPRLLVHERVAHDGIERDSFTAAYEKDHSEAIVAESSSVDINQKVEQLHKEFHAHLIAELSDGARKSDIQASIAHSFNILTNGNEDTVSDALQAIAITFASQIREQFDDCLSNAIAKAKAETWRGPLESTAPLRTAEDYVEFLGDFVDQHLYKFYNANSEQVENVAVKAAKMVSTEMNISPKLLPGLSKLALYDFIFLCDNSGSMQEEDRVDALEDTLRRTVKLATMLSSAGISVRILNNTHGIDDSRWDHLTTVYAVMDKMSKVSYAYSTPLGTRLWHKILSPLVIEKAKSATLKKPVMVIIITDGEANDEQILLDRSIYDCEEKLRRLGYPPASTIYLISRVGTSETARVFVEGLGRNKDISDMIYVSPADLAAKRTAFQNSGNDVAYTNMLIKLCLAALQVRTKDRRYESDSED